MSQRRKRKENLELVRAVIRELKGPFSCKDVVKKTRMNRKTAYRCLKQLSELGEVKVEGQGFKTRYRLPSPFNELERLRYELDARTVHKELLESAAKEVKLWAEGLLSSRKRYEEAWDKWLILFQSRVGKKVTRELREAEIKLNEATRDLNSGFEALVMVLGFVLFYSIILEWLDERRRKSVFRISRLRDETTSDYLSRLEKLKNTVEERPEELDERYRTFILEVIDGLEPLLDKYGNTHDTLGLEGLTISLAKRVEGLGLRFPHKFVLNSSGKGLFNYYFDAYPPTAELEKFKEYEGMLEKRKEELKEKASESI